MNSEIASIVVSEMSSNAGRSWAHIKLEDDVTLCLNPLYLIRMKFLTH